MDKEQLIQDAILNVEKNLEEIKNKKERLYFLGYLAGLRRAFHILTKEQD